MSFSTYADLQSEIRSFLWDRSDVAEKIPSFIQLAEAEMRRELKTRETNAVRKFYNTPTVPCGAKEIAAVRLEDGRELDYVAVEDFFTIGDRQEGTPRFFTVLDGRILFYPENETIGGEIVFVGSFEPLSDQCRSNWVLKEHPDIYLCGALKWAKAWLIDGDQDWATPFYSAISAANRAKPRVQMNTKIRANEVTVLARPSSFNVRTGGFR